MIKFGLIIKLLLFFFLFFIISSYAAQLENYYDTLGVSENATPKEIKKAYRILAKMHHPDKTHAKSNGKVGDPIMFQKITTAYETISDEDKRRAYDKKLDDARNGIINEDDEDYEEFVSKLSVFHVVLAGGIAFSIFQYVYFHRAYSSAYKDAYESTIYQNKIDKYLSKKDLLIQKGSIEEASILRLPRVYVEDRKKPEVMDLYIIQLFLLPYTLYKWNEKRLKRIEDVKKEAQKSNVWNNMSTSQRKVYVQKQVEEKINNEKRREESDKRKRREFEEEEDRKQENRLRKDHENKLDILRTDLRLLGQQQEVDKDKIEFACTHFNFEKLKVLIPLLKENKTEGLSFLDNSIEKTKQEKEKFEQENKKKRNSKNELNSSNGSLTANLSPNTSKKNSNEDNKSKNGSDRLNTNQKTKTN